MTDTIIYQGSDLQFNFTVREEEIQVATKKFSEATYKILDQKGAELLVKTIGNGITSKGLFFEILIDAVDIPFTGVFMHELTVKTSSGSVLATVFKDKIIIKEAY